MPLETTLARTPCPPSIASVPQQSDVDCLGDRIAELAARIQAATYALLVLVRQFDEQGGWQAGSFHSCAHWLSWRTGLAPGAAREKVRVAHALSALPLISAAMQRGQVSCSKVRALTRVATPENEAALLDVALAGTAVHVEQVTRAWRRVDRAAEIVETGRRHAHRELRAWTDDDGIVVIRGRLAPDVGAAVLRALDAASEQLRAEAADAPEEDTPEVSAEQQRADALGRVAEAALVAKLDPGTAGDRYQVVLHVDTATLAADADADRNGVPAGTPESGTEHPAYVPAGTSRPADPANDPPPRGAARVAHGQAVLEDAGGLRVSTATAQRLACDAGKVVVTHGAGGQALDVGRKTRTVPPALRRALAARDRRCRFPGCAARRCDAHHVRHWAHGGATRLDNLVQLCRRHHRAVHEGGLRVTLDDAGAVRFTQADGRLLPEVPESPRWTGTALAPVDARLETTAPKWDGETLDLDWAIDVLWRPRILDTPSSYSSSSDSSSASSYSTPATLSETSP